jgi:hypothetical protein
MKKFTILMSLFCFTIISGQAFAGLGNQNIFNPMEFTGTEAQKTKVIEGIQRNVHNTYCVGMNMCSASTLRMMENAEIEDFKYLVPIRGFNDASKNIFNRVVQTYCVDIDMCSYGTIKMMYDSEIEASKQTLTF